MIKYRYPAKTRHCRTSPSGTCEIRTSGVGPELELSLEQMLQETRFEELKRYVRFDARDAELLLAFRVLAAPPVSAYCAGIPTSVSTELRRGARDLR